MSADAPERPVRVEFRDRVARLTLDRPPLNVLTLDVLLELQRALEQVAARPGLKALVVAGAGRAFSAGTDVGQHLGDTIEPLLREFHRCFHLLRQLDAPSVALVRGPALGGGCELALGCDLVLAGESARFGLPEIKLGVFPPLAAALLPRLIGLPRALDLILTGRTISAAEAAQLGLVTRLAPDDRLEQALDELLGQLCEKSASSLRIARRAVLAGHLPEIERLLAEAEAFYLRELVPTHDATEGLRAFLEKRPPVWQDR